MAMLQFHSFKNSALDGEENITPRFDSFIRGKDMKYPLSRRLYGSQSWQILPSVKGIVIFGYI
jgi:hypothetical protein